MIRFILALLLSFSLVSAQAIPKNIEETNEFLLSAPPVGYLSSKIKDKEGDSYQMPSRPGIRFQCAFPDGTPYTFGYGFDSLSEELIWAASLHSTPPTRVPLLEYYDWVLGEDPNKAYYLGLVNMLFRDCIPNNDRPA